MLKVLYFLTLVAITFIVYSCANISTPTGGPKDETPPKLLKVIPGNNSINFTGNQIELIFDEPIALNNINEQLLVNPIVNNYEVTQRKNRLKLTFNQPFEKNQTYTFNFRDAVKDLTEGNINRDLKLAFSTGNILDTLKVVGNVKDLLTNKPKEKVLISLYKSNDTLSVDEDKPLYFTLSDNQGNFSLGNIKEGNYNLYAFEDNNKNLLYDNENEKIAIDTLVLNKNKTGLNLKVSKHYNTPPKVISKKGDEEEYRISFNKGIESGNLVLVTNKDSLPIVISTDGKVLTTFNINNFKDSIPVILNVVDSARNILSDTININFEQPEEKKKKEKETKAVIPFLKAVKPDDKRLAPDDISIQLLFNRPIKTINLNKITIRADSLKFYNIDNQDISIKNNKTSIIFIKNNIPFIDSLMLKIGKGAILGILNDSLPEQNINFSLKNENEFATIAGIVKTKEPNFILEILNEKMDVVKSLRNQKDFLIEYLPPGSYQMRAIVDTNNNGYWNPGNIKKGIKPEQVFFYPEKLELRANWEVRDLEFSF